MNSSDIDLTALHDDWSTTDGDDGSVERSDPSDPSDFDNSELDAWSVTEGPRENEQCVDEVEQVRAQPTRPSLPTRTLCSAYTKWNRRCCLGVEEGEEFCKRHKKMSFNTCGICYGNMYCEVKLACNHIFCRNCIYHWSNKGDSCPLCRKVMFYVNHSRDVIIKKASNMISKADGLIRHAHGFDEKFMTEVLEYLLENEWLKTFDVQYKSIMEGYVQFALENVKGNKRKTTKFSNLRKIIESV